MGNLLYVIAVIVNHTLAHRIFGISESGGRQSFTYFGYCSYCNYSPVNQKCLNYIINFIILNLTLKQLKLWEIYCILLQLY